MVDSLDLKTIFLIIWNKIIWIIISSLLGFFILFMVSYFLITPMYTSSAVLYVNNSSSSNESININDINLSQKLVNTYIIILQNETVLNSVASKLSTPMTNDKLLDAINIEAVNNTEVMNIEATTDDPYLSAEICNTFAEVAPGELARIVKAGSVEVISNATVQTIPSSPNILTNSAIGLFFGTVFSVCIVIFIYIIDTSIKTVKDLQKHFDIAILGEVPNFYAEIKTSENSRHRHSNKPVPQHIKAVQGTKLSKATPPNIIEAYKSIRTNLLFSLGNCERKTVIISSANSKECKSTTIANLAVTTAQLGAKVLIIDADMRNPVLHKIFKVSNDKGLSKLIINLNTLKDCIHKAVEPNLDILPSGAAPPNPSELLGDIRLDKILETLKQDYEYIFIDTPPINLVSDALIIAPKTDGIILLTRYKVTTYPNLIKTVEKINFSKSNILGFVFTDSRSSLNYKY